MKTIGIIGGISWVSTIGYYRLLNELVNERLGGAQTAKIILYSENFAEIKKLTEELQWDALAGRMIARARWLESAGADCLLIAANTMHHIADEVRAAISIPLIHIAVATADAIVSQQISTVALLGTKYTMQMDFFRKKLHEKGIRVLIPPEDDIQFINDAIYNELAKSVFLPITKSRFLKSIDQLVDRGARGIILGCTEIPLLIQPTECNVPVFDTMLIHARAAVDFALDQ